MKLRPIPYIFLVVAAFLLMAGTQSCRDRTKGPKLTTDCPNQSVEWTHDKMKGISFVAPPNPISASNFDPVKRINAEWVCIMPYAFVREGGSVVIYDHPFQWWGEQKEGVIKTIAYAKEKGLKVMMKPHLWTQGVFTGNYAPPDSSEWKEFEASYSEYLLDYAGVADSLGVELFCIGTEMKRAVKERTSFWTKLICTVRETYSGPVSYAANWDNFTKIPFWSELDVIGIDAYFPLDSARVPGVGELRKDWKPWIKKLSSFSEKTGKKIVFTEIGYRSMEYNTAKPWDAEDHGVMNEDAQARAYRAFFESMWRKDWMAGVFWWKWHPLHHKAGGPHNTRYTPQNKVGEQVLEEYFGQ